MNLNKKFIFLGLILIFTITSFAIFSFASEEKDYINRALKLIDEERYNEAVEELEEALIVVRSKADLEFVNVTFTDEEAWGFGMYNQRKDAIFAQSETFLMYGEARNYTIKEIKKDLNFDLFITNTLTQTSPFPVGDYKFLLVLKDVFSGKTTEVTIEFTVTE
jgi:hypothetical protein